MIIPEDTTKSSDAVGENAASQATPTPTEEQRHLTIAEVRQALGKRHPLLDFTEIITEAEEARRLELLASLSATQQKQNTLAAFHGDPEGNLMHELEELTRKKVRSMENCQIALGRLDATLDMLFEPAQADALKRLVNHVIGKYLHVDQYHSALHAISMTIETLHMASSVANINDQDQLATLVIQGLYHDTGNGMHPVPPDSEQGDEVQAVTVFLRDTEETDRRKREHLPLGELEALKDIRETMVTCPASGIRASQEEFVAAAIGGTVFRDRYEQISNIAFNTKYAELILRQLQKTSDPRLSDFRRFVALLDSPLVWLARDGDIAGSTEAANAMQMSLYNRAEDLRRGVGAGQGPASYRSGFLAFIGGKFSKGESAARQQELEGGALFYPASSNAQEGNAAASAVERYGRERLKEEERRFAEVMAAHGDMYTALFVLIEELAAGKHPQYGKNLLALTVRDLATLLRGMEDAPKERVNTALVKDAEKNLTQDLHFDLDHYPLLSHPTYQQMKLSELTAGTVNRMFAPGASLAQTTEKFELAVALFRAKKQYDRGDALSRSLREAAGYAITAEQEYVMKVIRSEASVANGKDRADVWNRLRAAGFTARDISNLCQDAVEFLPKACAPSAAMSTQTIELLASLERDLVGTPLHPILKSVLEIADLTPETLSTEYVDAGELLIEKGDSPGRVFIILQGTASVEIGPRRKILLSPGEPVGELSALTGDGATADVRAETPLTVLALPNHEIIAEFKNEHLRTRVLDLARRRMATPPTTPTEA
jgi:hypothetical protein